MAKKKKLPAKEVERLAGELLEHLGVEAQVEASQSNDGLVTVFLKTEEPALLIGFHGQALEAFQLLLTMMAYRQLGEWIRILVEVNDYRQKRRDSLQRLAFSVAQKVKFSNEAQVLPPMSSFERRIIHLALSEDSEVETVSEGEGAGRRVVIRPTGEGETLKQNKFASG